MDDLDPETDDEKNLEQVELASMGQRIGNFLLDGVFIWILSAFVESGLRRFGFAGFSIKTASDLKEMLVIATPVLIERTTVMALYFILLEALTGRTLAKFITGTLAINDDGSDLTFLGAVGRTLCRFIPLEAFSFFLPHADGVKGWHDRIPGTLVINLKKAPAPVSKKTWQS